MKRTPIALVSASLLVLACACGDPVPVAEITLAIRQPLEGDILAEPKNIALTVLVDGRDLGSQLTAPDVESLVFEVPLARDDEPDAATARTVSVALDVEGKTTNGLGRSALFSLPSIRDVQDEKAKAATVRVPVVLGVPNQAVAILDDLPGARTAPVVCSAPDGGVLLFGGTVGADDAPNGYLFDPQTLDARTTIAFVRAPAEPRHVTGCDVNSAGRVIVAADGLLFASDDAGTPEQICEGVSFDAAGPLTVRASGRGVMVASDSSYTIVGSDGCTPVTAFATAYPEPHIVALDGGGFAVGAEGLFWRAFDATGESASSGTFQFLAAGPDLVVTATQDADRVALHTPSGGAADVEFDKIGDVTIGTATVVAVVRTAGGAPAVLLREVDQTLRLVVERGDTDLSIPLDVARDAIGVTVGGAVLLFGGGTPGVDAVVVAGP